MKNVLSKGVRKQQEAGLLHEGGTNQELSDHNTGRALTDQGHRSEKCGKSRVLVTGCIDILRQSEVMNRFIHGILSGAIGDEADTGLGDKATKKV